MNNTRLKLGRYECKNESYRLISYFFYLSISLIQFLLTLETRVKPSEKNVQKVPIKQEGVIRNSFHFYSTFLKNPV